MQMKNTFKDEYGISVHYSAIKQFSNTTSVNLVFRIHSIGIPLMPYVAPAIAPANKAREQLQPPALIV